MANWLAGNLSEILTLRLIELEVWSKLGNSSFDDADDDEVEYNRNRVLFDADEVEASLEAKVAFVVDKEVEATLDVDVTFVFATEVEAEFDDVFPFCVDKIGDTISRSLDVDGFWAVAWVSCNLDVARFAGVNVMSGRESVSLSVSNKVSLLEDK